MKHKHLINIVLPVILLLVTVSCTIKDVEVGKIEGVNIKDISKEKINLELMVPVKNNSNFAFTISDVALDLSLNNVELGKITRASKLKIPANSNKVHAFEIEIKFKSLTENPFSLLSSLITNRIGLKANGYIKARKFIFTKKYHIDETETVKLFNKGLFK